MMYSCLHVFNNCRDNVYSLKFYLKPRYQAVTLFTYCTVLYYIIFMAPPKSCLVIIVSTCSQFYA